MRVTGLTRIVSGSCASDTPGQAPLRPQRRPPCPRHPVVGVCRRGGLRLGRHAAPRRGLTDSKLWGLALYGDPCVTCLPVTSPSNGGNCTIRGATRRRHAEGRLLMLQNPHHYPRRHAPARVERTRSGGILPMGRIPSEALRRKHASTMTDDASARHGQPHRRRDRASATDTSPDDAGTGPRATRCGATFQANREGQPVLKLVVSS